MDVDSVESIQGMFGQWIGDLKANKEPNSALEQRLRQVAESCDASLAAIPTSLDKARGCLAAIVDVGDFRWDQEYDAACLLSNLVPAQTVGRVVAEWKEALRGFLELQAQPRKVTIWNADTGESSV